MNLLVFITKLIMSFLWLLIGCICLVILAPILIPYIIIDYVIRMSEKVSEAMEDSAWN